MGIYDDVCWKMVIFVIWTHWCPRYPHHDITIVQGFLKQGYPFHIQVMDDHFSIDTGDSEVPFTKPSVGDMKSQLTNNYDLPSGYVNIAIESGHGNSLFTHK